MMFRWKRTPIAIAAVAALSAADVYALPAAAQAGQPAARVASTASVPAARELEKAGPEDYRSPVGRLEDGVLRVSLEAQQVAWFPWGEGGPELSAHAFAANGEPARVPGPLIRVTAGTPVHVTLRNGLDLPLVIRGLHDRGQPPGPPWSPFVGDSVALDPGQAGEVRFTPTVPGTYVYYGRVRRPGGDVVPPLFFSGDREDGPFVGVLIVDPPDAPPAGPDKIFLMTQWMDRQIRDTWDPTIHLMINGRSWPHTERLSYTEGDTVRWRVINASGTEHPMHLHGFFFRVDARGDQRRENLYSPGERRQAVTETVDIGETMRITWVPTEPGNWIFHCHLMHHMSSMQGPPPSFGPAEHDHAERGDDRMGGLVTGITVRPRDGDREEESVRRRLRLYTGMRPGAFGDDAAYGFVLQEGGSAPAPDSVLIPGSPIVLTRGEPTEIVVYNRLDFPLGVHWHGLELESWADGVPSWSGYPEAIRPAIAPGDSFVVRMTPPRAGTFMYHVHSEPGHELSQGLYGPFLVMDPGEQWEPATDRLFLLGSLGADLTAPAAVNGRVAPDPVELTAGTEYRFRFMHISPGDEKRVELLADGVPISWRLVAKDGADLPPSRVRAEPADLEIRVGETYDFRWMPEQPGELTLRITTKFPDGPPAFRRGAPPPDTVEIPVRITESSGSARAPWPTEEWRRVTPETVGLDSGVLDSINADIRAGEYGYVDRFLVIRGGRLAYDRRYEHDYDRIYGDSARLATTYLSHDRSGMYNYFNSWWHPYYRRGDLHTLQSVTKTVTSMVIGAAVTRGEFPSLDTPVLSYFDSGSVANVDDRKRRLTLRHLLTMTSGLEWDESDAVMQLESSYDWTAFAIDPPMAEEPGTRFNYNSGASQLLSYVFREAVGVDVEEYAARYLFAPLGIDDWFWKRTPAGRVDAEGGLYLRSEDLAKLWYLYLRDGRWDGKEVVSADWVSASLAPAVAVGDPSRPGAVHFGFNWWLRPNPVDSMRRVWAGDGFGGQFPMAVPEEDLIVVVNQWNILPGPQLLRPAPVLARIVGAATDIQDVENSVR